VPTIRARSGCDTLCHKLSLQLSRCGPCRPCPRSYSMVRSLSGQCETKRNNRPGSHRIAWARCFSLTPRPWWAGVVLAGCLGSASGPASRPDPHRLTPSSPRGGPSGNPLSHKRCLCLSALCEHCANRRRNARRVRERVAHGRRLV
jgi:hypothetical protein